MTHSEPDREAVLTGIQISGRTLYKLDERGVNIWFANFQPNSGYSEVEADKAAQAVFGCLSASPAPAAGGLEAVREAKTALDLVRGIIVEAAMTGFNCHDGDWAERLYASQADTCAAVKVCDAALTPPAETQGAMSPAPATGGASLQRQLRALAIALHAKHYAEDSPGWQPLEDAEGILSQIDNMAAGLSRAALASPAATSAETQCGDGVREALELVRPVIAGLIDAEYNVDTWGLKGRLAKIDAALGQSRVCEVCGGDCSAANPPPTYCPDRDGSGRNLADANSKSPSQSDRIAVLEAALRPFAKAAEHDIGSTETDADIFQQMGQYNRAPKITVGDMRRAHSALAPLGEE